MHAPGHHSFHLAVFFSFVVCLIGTRESSARGPLDRLPLQKKNIEIGQPVPMGKEFEGYDDNGKPIYWDPQPRVVPQGKGKYAFKWLGRNGKELTLIYERPDAVDLIVEASMPTSTLPSKSYNYKVRVLETSGVPLLGFVVQTFSSNATPVTNSTTFAGKMAGFIKQFEEGTWFRFAPFGRRKDIAPGEEADFGLISVDLPGLVECRAHGGSSMVTVVDEEPPAGLESLYLGHDAWPHGWTIGPDEQLAKMTLEERLKYLLERLPKMLELGWIENQQVLAWYETNLKAGKTAEVRSRAESDLKKNLITSEVHALMTYLTR